MEETAISPVEPDIAPSNEPVDDAAEEIKFTGDTEPDEQVEPEDDLEVTFVDNKLKIPKNADPETVERIKEIGRQLQAGFTQKTQRVADEARAVEAAKAALTQQMQTSQAFLEDVASLKTLDSQLEAYSKVDWQTYADQDPAAAQKHFMAYTALQNQRSQKVQDLQQKQQAFTYRQQQEQSRALAEGSRVLSEKIPDWGASKQQAIAKHVQEAYGYKPQELNNVMDPRLVLMMHDALLYRQSMQKAKAVPQKETPAPQPVQKVGSSAPAGGKDPDKMSMSDWMEWRTKQVERRRRR